MLPRRLDPSEGGALPAKLATAFGEDLRSLVEENGQSCRREERPSDG